MNSDSESHQRKSIVSMSHTRYPTSGQAQITIWLPLAHLDVVEDTISKALATCELRSCYRSPNGGRNGTDSRGDTMAGGGAGMSKAETDKDVRLIMEQDEANLSRHINRANIDPIYRWSPSEVREIAEFGLKYLRYARNLRREKKAPK